MAAGAFKDRRANAIARISLGITCAASAIVNFNMGIQKRVRNAPSLWPSDTNGSRYGVPWASCDRSATAATRQRASGGRFSTARTGTAQRAGRPRRAPGGGLPSRRRRQRRGARRGRRRGTFGRKARVHRPAAAAGAAVVDEYATMGRKARLHRPALVAVAVGEYVTFGRKTQLHPPSSGCGGGSGCRRILD